jgi:hypothetical protein
LLCARRNRPRDRRAAKQRDELAPSQFVELHSVPTARVELQVIEFAIVSQRA